VARGQNQTKIKPKPRKQPDSKLFKIPKGLDRCDQLIHMSTAPDLKSIWKAWDAIASQIIPADYDLRDCCETIDFDPSHEKTFAEIMDRMNYLSGRLDPARCFALDWAIRRWLGISQR
jgi:hypothetical protein